MVVCEEIGVMMHLLTQVCWIRGVCAQGCHACSVIHLHSIISNDQYIYNSYEALLCMDRDLSIII